MENYTRTLMNRVYINNQPVLSIYEIFKMIPYGYVLCCMIDGREHYFTIFDNWRDAHLLNQAETYGAAAVETLVKNHNIYNKTRGIDREVYSKPVNLSVD